MLLELIKFTASFIIESLIELAVKIVAIPKLVTSVPKLGAVFAGALV